MEHKMRLIAITKFAAVTEELSPFVEFQAAQKNLELTEDTTVAILQVENIPSYHIVFLDSEITMEELEEELGNNETVLAPDTKRILAKHLKKDT